MDKRELNGVDMLMGRESGISINTDKNGTVVVDPS